MSSLRQDILDYALKEYGTAAEYPWERNPKHAVLRNNASGKWYGVIMEIPRKTLKIEGDGAADILNIKLDPIMVGSLLLNKGFLPAYHMNKTSWISVLLCGEVPKEEIFSLLDMSYQLTFPKKKS